MKGPHLPAVRVLSARLFVRHLHETQLRRLAGSFPPGPDSHQGRASDHVRCAGSAGPENGVRCAGRPRRECVARAAQWSRRTEATAISGPSSLPALSIRMTRSTSSPRPPTAPSGPELCRMAFGATATEKSGCSRPPTGLSSGQIRSLYADNSGTLWIGTVDGGLNAFHDGIFVQYRARDGLAQRQHLRHHGRRRIALAQHDLAESAAFRASSSRISPQHRIKLLRPVNYTVSTTACAARRPQPASGWRMARSGLRPAAASLFTIRDVQHRHVAASVDSHPRSLHRLAVLLATLIPHCRRAAGVSRFVTPASTCARRIRCVIPICWTGWIPTGPAPDASRTVNYDSLGHGHYRFRVKSGTAGGAVERIGTGVRYRASLLRNRDGFARSACCFWRP